MENKICFKCGVEYPLSNFYKHKRMADGHLNKCIDCAKKDVSEKYQEKCSDPNYIENERKRGREKHHRLYSGMARSNPSVSRRWINQYPEKRAAQISAQRLKEEGKENHHWSYQEQHYKDVIFLTKKEHCKVHRFIVYDSERRMYRKYDTNELLSTRESHETFIRWCIENKED